MNVSIVDTLVAKYVYCVSIGKISSVAHLVVHIMEDIETICQRYIALRSNGAMKKQLALMVIKSTMQRQTVAAALPIARIINMNHISTIVDTIIDVSKKKYRLNVDKPREQEVVSPATKSFMINMPFSLSCCQIGKRRKLQNKMSQSSFEFVHDTKQKQSDSSVEEPVTPRQV